MAAHRVEFRSKDQLGSWKRLLGHFGGSQRPSGQYYYHDNAAPFADLACALFILLVREVIEVEHEIILTPNPDSPASGAAGASAGQAHLIKSSALQSL